MTLSVVWALRAARPTAAKTIAFIEAHPLELKTAEERRRIVETFAAQLNRLSFEERQNVQFDAAARRYHEQMTQEERDHCWQLTLSLGMHQMIEAFNRMTPETRRRHLNKALEELDRVREGGEDWRTLLSEQDRQWIVHEGLMRYLVETDPTTRLELQPIVERIQNILQLAR